MDTQSPIWAAKWTWRTRKGEDYPECEALLIYRGSERLRIDGIWCLPGEDFLRELRPDRGLIPV